MAAPTDPGFMAQLGGLLAGESKMSPLFNFGTGLLAASGPSERPISFGQRLASGMQHASQAQRGAMQNQLIRERILQGQAEREEAAKRQKALEELTGLLGGETVAPQQGDADDLSATTAAPDQKRVMGLLAQVAPEQFTKGLLAQMTPQDPTNLEREFRFLVSMGIPPEKAIEALKKGTTVNVGGAEPISVSDLTKIEKPDGTPFPPGTTLQQAVAAGGVVRTPEQQKQSNAASGSLDMLNDLDRVVRENKIETGFISEGGIAELLATAPGQVVSKGAKALGIDLSLSPAHAQALSLENNLSNAVLAAMRGASVGPEEQEKFERQLPRLSQPPEVFKANVINTRRNLEELARRSASNDKKAAPKTSQKKPAVIDFNELP